MNNDNRTNNSTQGVGKIRGAVGAIHGAGENIRGTLLGAIDTMSHNGETKNDDVAHKGRLEMEKGLSALRGSGQTTTGPGTANTGLGTGPASSEPQNGYPSHHRDDAITGLPPKQLEEVQASGQSGPGAGQPGGHLANDEFASHTSYGNTNSGANTSSQGLGQPDQGIHQSGRDHNNDGVTSQGSYGNENSAPDTSFDSGTGGQGVGQTGGVNLGSGRGANLGGQGGGQSLQDVDQPGRHGNNDGVTSQGSYGNDTSTANTSFNNHTGGQGIGQTGRGVDVGGQGVGQSIQGVDQPDRYYNHDGVTSQGSYGNENSATNTSFNNDTGGQGIGQTGRGVDVGGQGVGQSIQSVDQPDRHYNHDGVTSQGSYGNETSAVNTSFNNDTGGQGIGQTGRGVDVGGQGVGQSIQGVDQPDRYYNHDNVTSQGSSRNENSAADTFGGSTGGQGVGQTDRGVDLGSRTNDGYTQPSKYDAPTKTPVGYGDSRGMGGGQTQPTSQMGSHPNNYQDNTTSQEYSGHENTRSNTGGQSGFHPGGGSNI